MWVGAGRAEKRGMSHEDFGATLVVQRVLDHVLDFSAYTTQCVRLALVSDFYKSSGQNNL